MVIDSSLDTYLRWFFIGLLPCQYCELELPKLDLEEHENYCGSRTDKCLECGELVMFKNKQSHWDSNHGFLKLRDGKFNKCANKVDWHYMGVIHSLSKVLFLSFIKLALIGQATFFDQSPLVIFRGLWVCLVHMSGCVSEFCSLFMTILNICGQIVGKDIPVSLYVNLNQQFIVYHCVPRAVF